MNWREKLADWISGGEYSALIHDNGRMVHTICENNRRFLAIAAEAKRGKNPNATVRRLGKMAEEALG